jgi:hypothetical protein
MAAHPEWGVPGAVIMPRLVLVLILLLPGWVLGAAQGLSPKAGAVSEGLYTNLYFGMNYKLPVDWTVSFVAMDGQCERECMLLDVRGPGEKSRRAVTISAEQLAAVSGPERVTLAGQSLEQLGAKKIAPAKEISVSGRKSYRADYRSQLMTGEVYYTIIVLPTKDYAVVFSFSSESRKYLDTMVDDLGKGISFVGGS